MGAEVAKCRLLAVPAPGKGTDGDVRLQAGVRQWWVLQGGADWGSEGVLPCRGVQHLGLAPAR